MEVEQWEGGGGGGAQGFNHQVRPLWRWSNGGGGGGGRQRFTTSVPCDGDGRMGLGLRGA